MGRARCGAGGRQGRRVRAQYRLVRGEPASRSFSAADPAAGWADRQPAQHEHNVTARAATTRPPQHQRDRSNMRSAAMRIATILVLLMAAAAAAESAAAAALSTAAASPLSPSASPSLLSFPDLHPHRQWKLAERPHPHQRHCFQLALRHGQSEQQQQQQQQQSQPPARRPPSAAPTVQPSRALCRSAMHALP